MNAILPYLKRIAQALWRIAKMSASGKTTASKNTSAAVSSSSASMGGNVDTTDINEKIAGALIVNVTEEQEVEGQTQEVVVEKSIYDVMAQEIGEMLHSALFITVTEAGVQVEKPLLKAIAEDITTLNGNTLNNNQNQGS